MYEFKQLTGTSKFLSYKEWRVNDFVAGKVEVMKQNSKNPKVQDLVVTVLDSSLNNEKITLKSGDRFTINGTTALQKAVEEGIDVGSIVKVVYKGKETVKTGQWKGQLANALEVFVAPPQETTATTSHPIVEDDVL